MKNLFYLSLIAAATLFAACEKNEPEYDSITLETVEKTVKKGDVATVAIKTGSGKYSVASDKPEIAIAKLDGTKITITGVSNGKAIVTATDTETQKTAKLAVTVVVDDIVVNPAELTIEKGETAEANITTGSGKYGVASDNPEIATVGIEGSKVTITAVAVGETKIIVTDAETQKTAEIAVTVEATQAHNIYIQITTVQEIGATIGLSIDAAEADRKDVWIDLNGNGQKDEGEEKVTFGASVHMVSPYEIGAQTITIYGKVTKFGCQNNLLTGIDVSNNIGLVQLALYNNNIENIDVKPHANLSLLHFANNLFKEIDLSKNTELTYLSCGRNMLKELDISNNTKLIEIYCNNNEIKELNVGKTPDLKLLMCFRNLIENFDFSNNPKIQDVDCSNNLLKELDMSKNTELIYLRCYVNQLSSLDMSKNTNLRYLACSDNKISGENMTNLVKSLVNRKDMSKGDFRVIKFGSTVEQNVCTVDQVKLATDKNWDVKTYDNQPYPGS